jgi:NAD+ synthase (glutamine-hydrolysing)
LVNGRVVAQGSQFSLGEVEVVTATVDLEEVRSYRSVKSRAMQARETVGFQRFPADMSLSSDAEEFDPTLAPSKDIEVRYHLPEEEIACQCFPFPLIFNLNPHMKISKLELLHRSTDNIAVGPACYLWDYLRRCTYSNYSILSQQLTRNKRDKQDISFPYLGGSTAVRLQSSFTPCAAWFTKLL